MTSFQLPQEKTYQPLIDPKQLKTSSGFTVIPKAASEISSPPHLSMNNSKGKQGKFGLIIDFITDHLGKGDQKTKFISYFQQQQQNLLTTYQENQIDNQLI
jgi:hypothetical protein